MEINEIGSFYSWYRQSLSVICVNKSLSIILYSSKIFHPFEIFLLSAKFFCYYFGILYFGSCVLENVNWKKSFTNHKGLQTPMQTFNTYVFWWKATVNIRNDKKMGKRQILGKRHHLVKLQPLAWKSNMGNDGKLKTIRKWWYQMNISRPKFDMEIKPEKRQSAWLTTVTREIRLQEYFWQRMDPQWFRSRLNKWENGSEIKYKRPL